jgi:hypothetical protein
MPFSNVFAVSGLILLVAGCVSPTPADPPSNVKPTEAGSTTRAPDTSSAAGAPDTNSAATVQIRLPEWSTFSLGLRVLDDSRWARETDKRTYTIDAGVRRLQLYCYYRETTTSFIGTPGPVTPRLAEVTVQVDLAAKRQYAVVGSFVDTRCVPRIRDEIGLSVGAVLEARDSYNVPADVLDALLRIRPIR